MIEAYGRDLTLYFSFDTADNTAPTTSEHPVEEKVACDNQLAILEVIYDWLGKALKKKLQEEGNYKEQNPRELAEAIMHGFFLSGCA